MNNHHEAETVRMQSQHRQRYPVHLTAVPVAVVAVALAVVLTSCATAERIGTPLGSAPVTVIATSSPAVTATPVAFEPTSAPSMSGYRLVFNDEFIGPKVSTARWETSVPWGNTTQGEQQYYTPAALSQSGGVLTITASRKATNGKPYASGAISSPHSYKFTYGYAEIRAQVPAGNGLWSAFWLLGTVPGRNEEVDILEVLGSDPTVGFASLHYGVAGNGKKSVGSYRNADCSEGFHTFAVDWEPEHMIWYVDGVERRRLTANIPTQPMYLIANLSVGTPGSWAGSPNRYTAFPAQLKIDYIRVFERN
jgi:beta-glucanase (GH16 family)